VEDGAGRERTLDALAGPALDHVALTLVDYVVETLDSRDMDIGTPKPGSMSNVSYERLVCGRQYLLLATMLMVADHSTSFTQVSTGWLLARG
jgi:hypothetical protein